MSSQPYRRSSKKKSRKNKAPSLGVWLGLFAGACLVAATIWGVSRFISGRPAGSDVAGSDTGPASNSDLTGSSSFDYVAQLDQQQAAGATPENNLAVVIARVGGSGQATPEAHAQFEKRLGVSVPRESQSRLTMDQFHQSVRNMSTFQYTPWRVDHYPEAEQYLESIRSELDQFVTDSEQCSHFYWPRIADRTTEGMKYAPASSINASHVGTLRVVAQALAVRSLMNYQRGERLNAQRDALASLRLGNFMSLGRLSVEQVGASCRTHALRALLPIVNSDQVTREQLIEIENLVSQIPANAPSDVDIVNSERIMMLDVATAIQTQGMGVLTPESEGPTPNIPISLLAADKVDYDVARKVVNRWVDRVQAEVAIVRSANARNTALLALDAELKAVINASPSQAKNRTEAGERLGNTVFVTQSYFSLFLNTRATYETYRELLLLVIKFRKSALDGNALPQTLSEFLGEAPPRDRFTGDELVYRLGEVRGQVIIYSRGSNGTDDGGKMPFGNWISHDDLGMITYWYGSPF